VEGSWGVVSNHPALALFSTQGIALGEDEDTCLSFSATFTKESETRHGLDPIYVYRGDDVPKFAFANGARG